MSDLLAGPSPIVVVTGANGLVGSELCRVLSERGATVRALVRRAGTAPPLPGVEEVVGDFTDPDVADDVVLGADAVVTTVHPMGSDLETQERVGVAGTTAFVRAAADAGVELAVHLSTAAVYDRSPGAGDVDEASPLVGDDGGDYAVTKRDLDLALAGIDQITRVLLRPPAILGAGESSVWNSLRPERLRDDEEARHATPHQSWPWVHVTDLAGLAADLVTGHVALRPDPSDGPVLGACTAVNVVGGTATWRDYQEAAAAAAGVEPVWDDEPVWTGALLADRAGAWGWQPEVELGTALAEVTTGSQEAGA